MQLRLEQLPNQLQKNLLPIYLVSGDEPLLIQETCDLIRERARQVGFSERQIFHTNTAFSWTDFLTFERSFSLFNDKQLLELHVNKALGDAGSKALQAYAADSPADKILLIITEKLDAAAQKTLWFQAIAKIGAIIPIWPLEKNQFTDWLRQRLLKAGLKTDPVGLQLLAENSEGNLLAAAQEIEKLRLLYGQSELTPEQITKAISDNARFDIFALSDSALQNDSKRALRILKTLREEGVEPVLVLWSLARELRTLAMLAFSIAQGNSVEKSMQEQRIWEKRKLFFRTALQRHTTTTLQRLLSKASRIDRIIKGVETGNIWDELSSLTLGMTRT